MIDTKSFSIMLAIIACAFANFYFVIDAGDRAQQYVGDYTDNELVNNLMEMYFISIGNFNTANYGNGANSIIIWIFFMMAAFIIVIVFMNLLIGIMSNTLNDVTEVQEQSTYQQQTLMIMEYYYLIDLKKEFKKYKYVVYVSKQKKEILSSTDETNMMIKDFNKNLFKLLESNSQEQVKSND